ncbi:MAG: zf-HC2 domain-containing protein, partial [Acidobacteriota bacterium]|nr:zf-HC2 domain-containing protein [Acidobacteriota bacterium]
MSEKPEATPPGGCGRGEELVAYLYGEAAPDEAEAFGRHLNDCAACREELAAFGGVREAVGAWRAEALGTVPPLNVERALAPAPRKRSARAALGEFFS